MQFVGVNPQGNDTDAAQARMLERAGVTYPTVQDAQDDLLREFNTTGGLPTTLRPAGQTAFTEGETGSRWSLAGVAVDGPLRDGC